MRCLLILAQSAEIDACAPADSSPCDAIRAWVLLTVVHVTRYGRGCCWPIRVDAERGFFVSSFQSKTLLVEIVRANFFALVARTFRALC